MAKTLTIHDPDKEGIEYLLEYDRRTIMQMEQNGFVADMISEKPMTMIPMLVSGAFLKHCRYVQQRDIDRIYDSIDDKEDFIGCLSAMYAEPIEALLEAPKKGKGSKKVEWKKNW